MTRSGPPRKPTALKVIEGTVRKDRLNLREPIPPAKMPTCPAWLSPDAKSAWRRLAPKLHERGLLSEWDRDAFATLCEAISQHKAACEAVTRDGVLVKGAQNQRVKHPAMQIVRDTSQTIRAYAQEFGLTPSARSSIVAPESGTDDLLGILDA